MSHIFFFCSGFKHYSEGKDSKMKYEEVLKLQINSPSCTLDKIKSDYVITANMSLVIYLAETFHISNFLIYITLWLMFILLINYCSFSKSLLMGTASKGAQGCSSFGPHSLLYFCNAQATIQSPIAHALRGTE